VPGEFLAVDVRVGCCAAAIDFHAVSCDVSLFFGQESRVTWGVGKAAKMPKKMMMPPSTKKMNGLNLSVKVFLDSDV
jgi:hypothetical protein